MNYWMAVGPQENWTHSFENGNIWGCPGSTGIRTQWTKANIGDILFFYITSPVKGIIGYGKIIAKSENTIPFWPIESGDKPSRFPLRIGFERLALIPHDKWTSEDSIGGVAGLARMGSWQVINHDLAKSIISALDEYKAKRSK